MSNSKDALLKALVCVVIGAAALVTPGAQYDGQWKTFAPAEGRFAVMMPGVASHYPKTEDTAKGKIVQHSYGLKTEKGLLEVVFAEYPFTPDPAAELSANRDRFVADAKTKVVSEWKINYRGNPGIEFRCENKDSTFIARIYVMERTVYEIAGGGYDNQIDYDEISRFLNSFQLVDEKAAQ